MRPNLIIEIILIGVAIAGAAYMLYKNTIKEYKCGSCSSCPYSCSKKKDI